MPTDREFLSPIQLGELLQIPVPTIHSWRHKGEGPKGYKVGRHLRYRRVDVDSWLEQQGNKTGAR
jgi:excisionase family DNA binding protein